MALRNVHRAIKPGGVAASAAAVDDVLEAYCQDNGILCIRGPEEDVLARYAMAAKATSADVVVRVTGDAPLVDQYIIDRLIEALIDDEADYATIDRSIKTIHEGFSPFTVKALEKLANEVPNDPVAKEHVTAYFKAHPDFVKTTSILVGNAHQFTGARISVDTPADLAFLEAVYDELGASPGEADVTDVVTLLRQKPFLLEINGHVHQKAATEVTKRVLFRCDGGKKLGMGHVVRCLALADALRETHGFGVTFVMEGDPFGMGMVHNAGYPLATCHLPHQVRFLDRLIEKSKIDAVILDVRDNLPAVAVERWSDKGVLSATQYVSRTASRGNSSKVSYRAPPSVALMNRRSAAQDCTALSNQAR